MKKKSRKSKSEPAVKTVKLKTPITLGEITFANAESSTSRAEIIVDDYKYVCLLFDVNAAAKAILSKPEEERDHADFYVLQTHALDLVTQNIHRLFIDIMAEAFHFDFDLAWGVHVTYTDEPSPRRIIVFHHPEGITREDYVLPLTTRARLAGKPFLAIECELR